MSLNGGQDEVENQGGKRSWGWCDDEEGGTRDRGQSAPVTLSRNERLLISGEPERVASITSSSSSSLQ